MACFVQQVTLTGAWEQVAAKYYVWLLAWDESPTKLIYDRLQDQPGWNVQSWPVSHDVVTEAPDELIALLLAAGDSDTEST